MPLELPLDMTDRKFVITETFGETFATGENHEGPTLMIEIKSPEEARAVQEAIKASQAKSSR